MELCVGIMIFIFTALDYQCPHSLDPKELENIINLIKERTNSYSSIWCKGKGYLYSKTVKEGKIEWETEQEEYFEIAFTCDKKNFFLTFYDQKILYDSVLSPKQVKISSPSNEGYPQTLLDTVKQKIEQKAFENYQNTNHLKDTVEPKISKINSASYMKNGKTWFLNITEDKQKAYKDPALPETDFIPCSQISPLNMVGRVGEGTEDNFISTWGISLSEFLDLPGPFHLHHEGDFTVLWHKTEYYEDAFKKKVPLSLDIWIDDKGDIRRIDYVEYYGRTWDLNTFKKYKLDMIVNCMSPKWIEKTYFFDDYIEVKENIRFPLKAREEVYSLDTTTPEGLQLRTSLKSGKITKDEYMLQQCFSPIDVTTLYKLEIIPESLKINEIIPDEIFTPPPIMKGIFNPKDFEKSNQIFLFSSKSPVIYIVTGVVILLLIMYITYRYLGWSFF
ncbi:MAG TPA: hypothetical protein PLA12_11765 [Candidatus Hydrogenedens sp.]|nr:hypothetical protein [Candidatus Hydrogenedens sp.]